MEICLPAQESYSGFYSASDQAGSGYIDLVHAIGFRLTGQIFYVLPGCQSVLLSGYVADSGRTARYDNKSYLYSSKVSADDWSQVDIDEIESLDMVACFNLFETRRQITHDGRLAPVERIRG